MLNGYLGNQLQGFLNNPQNQYMIQNLLQSNPQLAQQLQQQFLPQQQSPLTPVQPPNAISSHDTNPVNSNNQDINNRLGEYDAKLNEYTNVLNSLSSELESLKTLNNNLTKRLDDLEDQLNP